MTVVNLKVKKTNPNIKQVIYNTRFYHLFSCILLQKEYITAI